MEMAITCVYSLFSVIIHISTNWLVCTPGMSVHTHVTITKCLTGKFIYVLLFYYTSETYTLNSDNSLQLTVVLTCVLSEKKQHNLITHTFVTTTLTSLTPLCLKRITQYYLCQLN